MSASTSLENNFLDVFVGNSATSATLQLGAIGLNVGDPTDAGTGGSPASGGGYADQSVSASSFGLASSGSVTNSGAAIEFPESTGAISSGSSLDYVRFLTGVGGTYLGALPLTTARTVSASGVTLRFATSALTLTAD